MDHVRRLVCLGDPAKVSLEHEAEQKVWMQLLRLPKLWWCAHWFPKVPKPLLIGNTQESDNLLSA